MKTWVVRGLIALALAQIVAILSAGVMATPGSSRWVMEGDRIADLEVTDAEDRVGPLAASRPTLVLVFHSECAHCLRVAPTWAAWLDEHRGELAVVAVSSESYEKASAYAAEHGWGVPVRTVVESSFGTRGHALTSRTPWIFALEESGVVISGGHGDLIADLGALILDPTGGVEPGS
jgi:thiol-disulfide isomerase/thioredoxin